MARWKAGSSSADCSCRSAVLTSLVVATRLAISRCLRPSSTADARDDTWRDIGCQRHPDPGIRGSRIQMSYSHSRNPVRAGGVPRLATPPRTWQARALAPSGSPVRCRHEAMERPRYIAVEGPIGAGKTTLAQALAERLEARLVAEVAEENPFLASFYADRKKHAFQAQLFFLLSRFQQQQVLFQQDLFTQSTIADYLFARDRIFAALTLSPDE